MKILWLGGIILPKISEKEGFPINPINGWLIRLSEELKQYHSVDLVYLCEAPRIIEGKNEFYSYYTFQLIKKKNSKEFNSFIERAVQILKKEKPDVVHIWGTEYLHSLAMTKACERVGILDRVVVSIQGMVSVYSKHYCAYLPHNVVTRYLPRDILKGSVAKGAARFAQNGEAEKETLKKVHHVIGRTDWDRACTWDINPELQYHFNNETLRKEFYTGEWKYESCEKYSIFCSQAHYPIKGIHMAIEALHRVTLEYPNAHLYVGGKDHLNMPAWKKGSYSQYLTTLIKKYDLENNISFLGFLSAEEMKKRYLSANVFVSAASIENSPNSLGEAMMLGVPCIASGVGGVHNLLTSGEEGYIYPADEPYMLAYYICDLFRNKKKACDFGDAAKKHAAKTHDPDINRNELIKIYNEIIR